MTDAACGQPAQGREPHFWERTSAIWHAVFVLGMIAAAFGAYNEHGLRRPRGVTILLLIAALAIWYFATGARALHRNKPWLGLLYLAGLIPTFAVLIALDPGMGYLLFFMIPQVYVFVDSLLAASACVVGLYVVFATILLVGDADARDHPGPLLFSLAISMTFALIFGGWIHGIIRQSAKRADLIAELERTRAELAAERHEAGVLTERGRLAAEIHDTLAQGFTSILMLTQAAEASIRRDPDAAEEALTLIERTARENLAEARSLVAALAPAALDGSTLPEALRRLADRHREETNTDVSVAVVGTPAPSPDTDVVLLRVAQEALANVRRHARAGTVAMALGYGTDGVTLAVRDDGVGFNPAALAANGAYGLRGMRHRVEQSGGTVTVRSEPGSGTTVEVTLP